MDLKKLHNLSDTERGCISKIKTEVTVGLDRSHYSNLKLGAVLYLNSKLQKYFESFNGVLLGFDDIDIVKSPSDLHPDLNIIHVVIKGLFFIFSPVVDGLIEGMIISKTNSSIKVTVNGLFHVLCLSPKNTKKIEVGNYVKVKLSSVAYVDGRPQMLGDIDKVTNNDKSLVYGHSSQSSVLSPNKRKTEEDDNSRKRVRTVSESVKSAGDTTQESDTDNNDVLSTPKSSKTPGKTPKEKLTLPDGFTILEKKTEKKSWKEYVGPDGKRYRSIAEIYRSMEGGGENVTKTTGIKKVDSAKVTPHIDEITETWNMTEEGELNKNKNKFYTTESLKKLPKTDKHFTAIKGKNSFESNDDDDDEAPPPLIEKTVSLDETANSTSHSDTLNESKKKKKKKKNKNKEM